MEDDAYVTRLYLEGGSYIRVSEPLGYAGEILVDATHADGWAAFTDPGDERSKLVRASRVMWLEQEADV